MLLKDVRAVEQELARKDERLQMALTASGAVGLWDWMVESDLLHGDANFARLYGLDVSHTAAGLTMEQYQQFVVPEDVRSLRESIRGVFEREENFLVEYRLAVPGQPLRWVECRGRMIADDDGEPARFSGTAVDITERKTGEEQKHLLMTEMSHRVKNTFAMVQSIVVQTLKGTDQQVSETLQSRLAALGGAHDILLQAGWSVMAITDVVAKVLGLNTEGDRFQTDGPQVQLAPDAALSLSLLLHELATNASKYGSLSVDGGKVLVDWTVHNGVFQLRWIEQGGPPATEPTRHGFGSKLIGMGLCGTRQADLSFTETGLQAEFSADLQRMAAVAAGS